MVKKISEYEYKRADVDAAIAFLDVAVKKANAATDVVALAATRDEVNAYFADFYTLVYIAAIRHTLDVRDKFYAAEQDYYDENMPRLAAKTTEFNKAFISSPHADRLGEVINPLIVDKIKASLRVMDDKIIADCVEENKLVTEYDKLLAELTYP